MFYAICNRNPNKSQSNEYCVTHLLTEAKTLLSDDGSLLRYLTVRERGPHAESFVRGDLLGQSNVGKYVSTPSRQKHTGGHTG